MKYTKQGFTLIELLVVIAIIGILSAIVLASLDTARSKGQDAAARADLDNARAQAESYYDSKSPVTYSGVCTTATGATPGGIQDMMTGAASAEGGVYTPGATLAASGVIVCHDPGNESGATTWVAATSLKNAVSGYSFWCVDSTGTSTPVSGLAAAATVCP